MAYHTILRNQLKTLAKAIVKDDIFSLDELLYQISKTYTEQDQLCAKLQQENAELKALCEKRDLLEQKKTIRQLQENEKKYRSLYEISSDAVLIIENEKIIDCNISALEMFGYESVDVFKKVSLEDLWPRVDQTHQESHYATQRQSQKGSFKKSSSNPSQPLYHFEWIHKRLNGELFPAEVIFYGFEVSNHYLIQAVIRDITKQKQIEENLIRAKEAAEQESHAKTNFLANMSHEIRTPTNAIIGFCDLLLPTNLDEQQKNMVSHLRDSAKLLLTIINDILVFSSLEEGALALSPSSFDLNQFFHHAKRMSEALMKEKDLVMHLSLPSKTYYVEADEDRLKQVIINLISNAIKFTEHGFIKIQLDCLEETDYQMTFRCAVMDTGIGISKETQKKLFQRFQQGDISLTKKHQGTGLGLAICKNLIELMGGTIGVESEEEKGSTFWFVLTLNKAKNMSIDSPQEDATDTPKIPDLTGVRVLLAEDNRINQMVMQGILGKANIHIDCAENGEIAVQKIKQNDYDVVLMDIHMPIMDGYTATQLIRNLDVKKKRDIPIIALTANVMPHEMDRCTTAGMNDYLTKPISIEKFFKTLTKHVSK